ncbi:hypothetical protein C4K35_4749 [Pseudomonas chlororaphis subsp. piscium]|uniref:hypothetical protein n=1 Tax=Pseudomonas chlororaphis TaxID=587753 RepID=UPI000F577F7B|nr:hypothetical protein [Pseudomonas chlororaphis]AZC52318.1 hypothetical protein C4K35_4749 [Pseudomonas chlororaphis subsp. piscium]
MISNHLSLVEALRPASNELAAAVEQFLAAGGQIEEGPASGYKPKPITYSNQMPPAPKPFVRRRVELKPSPTAADIRHKERMAQVETIRKMAATHTQSEIVEALGISRRKLYNIAHENDLTFKRPIRGGANDEYRKGHMKARDAKFAERIRAFLELGITRRQVCGKLGISNKTLERILAEHGIDYPKARRGCTSCAA